ncbi:hypothetical protein [Herbidospora cretacea]|uniref:hypothetical protein n=1 Tax=Herbidospora cretacea TaxID=28444 RepID=UPI000A605484|nr:hypothetical protein [Herbidospora cretacea]
MTIKNSLRTLAMEALLAVPLAAVSATPAMAATNVVASGGQLVVSAGSADDDISINVEGGFLVVRNFNDAIFAGSVTCTNVDPRTVRCTRTGITKMLARTNTGADTVRKTPPFQLRPFSDRTATSTTAARPAISFGRGGALVSSGPTQTWMNWSTTEALIEVSGSYTVA